MKPFLKWAGGKRWLVARHDQYLPREFSRYFEPFLGGAAVFFSLQPKSALLSDCNRDLIEVYSAIRDEPDAVWAKLRAHSTKHSKTYYYRIRSSSPRTVTSKASKFIYLNRACFNGLYRVNKKGVFNVPKGTKDTIIFPDEDFRIISSVLKTCELREQDFEESLDLAGPGDFIYLDPPYTVQHNNNNFVKYNELLFSWEDQERLSGAAFKAAARGAKVLISNADNECIHDLYSDPIWHQLSVSRHSILASDTKKRRLTTELLISNYLDDVP